MVWTTGAPLSNNVFVSISSMPAYASGMEYFGNLLINPALTHPSYSPAGLRMFHIDPLCDWADEPYIRSSCRCEKSWWYVILRFYMLQSLSSAYTFWVHLWHWINVSLFSNSRFNAIWNKGNERERFNFGLDRSGSISNSYLCIFNQIEIQKNVCFYYTFIEFLQY